MKIVNLTGSAFSLHDTRGELVTIDADPRYVGLVAVGDHQTIENEGGHAFSLNVRRVRGVKGMPDPVEDTIYVVPIEVAMALQDQRDDVFYLAEDAEVRTTNGCRHRISHLRRTVLAHPIQV